MKQPRPSLKSSFAERIRGLVQSDIRRMSRECERAGGINLGQGICDQPAPESRPVVTALLFDPV